MPDKEANPGHLAIEQSLVPRQRVTFALSLAHDMSGLISR